MFRKAIASRPILDLVLVITAAFAIGFTLTYGWVQRHPVPAQSGASLNLPGSDKDQDGLVGPVNRVRTETAKLSVESGSLVEGQRELLELTAYDLKGNRTDNSYYLISNNTKPGKEEYAYDDRGRLIEMTLRDVNNSIMHKEVYSYEYDALGNWTKMLTSSVVYEGGKLNRQPTEVTYRNITYYFDQAVAEITKSPSVSSGTQSPTGAQGDFAELRAAFDEWIAATNARDIEKLMGFYDSEIDTFYLTHAASRESVRAEKIRLFSRSDVLNVRADAPEITLSGDRSTAAMRFRKQYLMKRNGREREGEVLQQLRWRRTAEGWKITGERDAQVIR